MTEAQWVACTSPGKMLTHLQRRPTDRKLRLFAVACCGRIAELITDPRSLTAVRVAEQFADGRVSTEHLAAAARAAQQVNAWFRRGHAGEGARQEACAAASATTITQGFLAARRTSEYAREAGRLAGLKGCSRYQSVLLRDIFGPLLFRVVRIDPGLLVWNEGTIMRLVQAIYDNRILPAGTLDNPRLAVLADALEEAGCDNEEILSHLHQQGAVHVRGCWAIDSLLGKE